MELSYSSMFKFRQKLKELLPKLARTVMSFNRNKNQLRKKPRNLVHQVCLREAVRQHKVYNNNQTTTIWQSSTSRPTEKHLVIHHKDLFKLHLVAQFMKTKDFRQKLLMKRQRRSSLVQAILLTYLVLIFRSTNSPNKKFSLIYPLRLLNFKILTIWINSNLSTQTETYRKHWKVWVKK
jgi:hypothetical protein